MTGSAPPHGPRLRLSGSIVTLALITGVSGACETGLEQTSRPPQAFAGFDVVTRVDQPVTLDGSHSFDPDGDTLTYRWRLVRRPPQSAAALSGLDEPLVSLVPDASGTYLLSLTVSDAFQESVDLVGVHASEAAPVGTSRPRLDVEPSVCNVLVGVERDGDCARGGRVTIAAKARPNSIPAALDWTFVRLPAGLSASDLEVMTSTPAVGPLSFRPPRPGAYWVAGQLIAASSASAPRFSTIVAHPPHVDISTLPRPRIEGASSARVGESLLLDGGATENTSSTTRYRWEMTTDPSDGLSPLSDRATGCPANQCRRFVPLVAGTYVISLEAGTATATGAPALLTVEVEP